MVGTQNITWNIVKPCYSVIKGTYVNLHYNKASLHCKWVLSKKRKKIDLFTINFRKSISDCHALSKFFAENFQQSQ